MNRYALVWLVVILATLCARLSQPSAEADRPTPAPAAAPSRLAQPPVVGTAGNPVQLMDPGEPAHRGRPGEPPMVGGDGKPCAAQLIGAAASEERVMVTVQGSANKLVIEGPDFTLTLDTAAVCSAGMCRAQLGKGQTGPYSVRFDDCPAVHLGGGFTNEWADRHPPNQGAPRQDEVPDVVIETQAP